MTFSILASNGIEALKWAFRLPFFSFNEALGAKPIIFDQSEIIKVEVYRGRRRYCIHFSKSGFEGHLFVKEVPEELKQFSRFFSHPVKSPIGFFLEEAKRYLARFWVNSPSLVTILLSIMLSFIIVYLRNWSISTFLAPENFINENCNTECVKLIFSTDFIILLAIVLSLTPLFVGILYFFVISKKIKWATFYASCKVESILMGFMAIANFFLFAGLFIEEPEKFYQLIELHKKLNL